MKNGEKESECFVVWDSILVDAMMNRIGLECVVKWSGYEWDWFVRVCFEERGVNFISIEWNRRIWMENVSCGSPFTL